MAEPLHWLALGYSVPINPSKNRVYVWRKLKEYGAEYFKQGVALLPYTRTSYTKFKYLSGKIRDMGGDASIVEMKFLESADEQEVIYRFRKQELEELNELKKDCAEIMAQLTRQTAMALTELQGDQIKKLIRRYSKARERSHFCGTLAEDVENGIYSMLELLRSGAGDAAAQFFRAMDKAVK